MTHPDDQPLDGALVPLALAELGALPFPDHSLDSLLHRVAGLTVRLLPADVAASVTVVSEGRPTTLAATDDLALDLDQVQYRLGAGPCLQAAVTGELVEVPELSSEERWADFAVQAADRGCRAMVSAPFPPTTGALAVTGGVNLYVRSAQEWDQQARQRAARFLEQAAVPVMNRYLLETSLARVDHLETAMASRAAIEQAKGILMERLKFSPEQAFEALARSSMATNTKLRDVAERVVRTGEFHVG